MVPTCTYIGHVDGTEHRKALARIKALEAALREIVDLADVDCDVAPSIAKRALANQNIGGLTMWEFFIFACGAFIGGVVVADYLGFKLAKHGDPFWIGWAEMRSFGLWRHKSD